MSFYVFNIGFNRSGSTSLISALNILKIPSIHNQVNNIPIQNHVRKNILFNEKLLYSLDKKYRGFGDFSGELYYKKLYKQYPNSKFILTIRDFCEWEKSHKILEEKISTKFKKIKLLHTRENFNYDTNIKKKYFENYNNIKDFFKYKQNIFLEMRICDGEGWDTLCKFLNTDIPNEPFPHLNKTEF